MTTIERALHVLIHDVRTPLGVAQGYLRLLHEGRLTTPEAAARAITQVQQALDRVATLCDDAAALADRIAAPAGRRVVVPCRRFVANVRERLAGEPLDVGVADDAGALEVPGDTDELAAAVARVLLAPRPTGPGRSVAVGTTATELWFTSGMDEPALSGAELDCWRGGGFALPLACQTIAGAGGRVWTAGPASHGAGVALPIEVVR